jgi:hypothetical protein
MKGNLQENAGHKKTAFTVMRPTKSFTPRVMSLQMYNKSTPVCKYSGNFFVVIQKLFHRTIKPIPMKKAIQICAVFRVTRGNETGMRKAIKQ